MGHVCGEGLPCRTLKCRVLSDLPKYVSLGWHVYRAKLARCFFLELRIVLRKCSEISPEIFEPLFCGSKEIPPNSFQTSHKRISCKSKKNHRWEFCKSAECSFFISLSLIGERLRGNRNRGNRPERFWEVLRGFGVSEGVSERVSETTYIGEVVTMHLSETLSECHFPLRAVGLVAPNRVAPWNSYNSDILFPYRSPSPRPHPTPRNAPETDLKQTRNGPKRTRNEPKRTQHRPKSGGLSGWGGSGGCKGKRKLLSYNLRKQQIDLHWPWPSAEERTAESQKLGEKRLAHFFTPNWKKAELWEGDEDNNFFSFHMPAVHWMARTSSLNCLSCRNPYQTLEMKKTCEKKILINTSRAQIQN